MVVAKTSAKPASKSRRASRKPPAPKAVVDLYKMGARVVSVYGAFNSRVLIEMPAAAAEAMFPAGLGASGSSNVIEAVEREMANLGEGEMAESALAAVAQALAREVEHPYNSATSKSMCSREIREALDRARELAPPKQKADAIDDIAAQRVARRAKLAGSAAATT